MPCSLQSPCSCLRPNDWSSSICLLKPNSSRMAASATPDQHPNRSTQSQNVDESNQSKQLRSWKGGELGRRFELQVCLSFPCPGGQTHRLTLQAPKRNAPSKPSSGASVGMLVLLGFAFLLLLLLEAAGAVPPSAASVWEVLTSVVVAVVPTATNKASRRKARQSSARLSVFCRMALASSAI